MEETCPARRGGGRGHCGGRGTDAPGWRCDGARPGRPEHLRERHLEAGLSSRPEARRGLPRGPPLAAREPGVQWDEEGLPLHPLSRRQRGEPVDRRRAMARSAGKPGRKPSGGDGRVRRAARGLGRRRRSRVRAMAGRDPRYRGPARQGHESERRSLHARHRPDHLLPDRDEPQHRTAMRDEFGQVRSLPSTLSSCHAQKAIDRGMGTIKVDGKALTGNQLCDVVAFPYDRGPRWESEMDRFASVERVISCHEPRMTRRKPSSQCGPSAWSPRRTPWPG